MSKKLTGVGDQIKSGRPKRKSRGTTGPQKGVVSSKSKGKSSAGVERLKKFETHPKAEDRLQDRGRDLQLKGKSLSLISAEVLESESFMELKTGRPRSQEENTCYEILCGGEGVKGWFR